jgi:hypothetical protein
MSTIASAINAPIRRAEKAIWRIGACMLVRRRPAWSCFIEIDRSSMGIWSWVGAGLMILD